MVFIENIAREFVYKKFNQSKKTRNFEKAQEAYDYVTSKTPAEISKEIGNTEFDEAMIWKNAMNIAYKLMGKYLLEI